jgi:hypothetical protein
LLEESITLTLWLEHLGLELPPASTLSENLAALEQAANSSQEGLEEVLGLGVKVVSISGAKGKKIIEARQWKSQPYRQARAERSAIESLLFTLKEGFEFGELVRRTHEHVLAEMLEKMLAYNISQIIRVRKKLSELQEMQRAAA